MEVRLTCAPPTLPRCPADPGRSDRLWDERSDTKSTRAETEAWDVFFFFEKGSFGSKIEKLGGGFKNFFIFTSTWAGEDSHFYSYFSDCLKPPTSRVTQFLRARIKNQQLINNGFLWLQNFRLSCQPPFLVDFKRMSSNIDFKISGGNIRFKKNPRILRLPGDLKLKRASWIR